MHGIRIGKKRKEKISNLLLEIGKYIISAGTVGVFINSDATVRSILAFTFVILLGAICIIVGIALSDEEPPKKTFHV